MGRPLTRAEAAATLRRGREIEQFLAPTWRLPVLYRLFFPAVGRFFLGSAVVWFAGAVSVGSGLTFN